MPLPVTTKRLSSRKDKSPLKALAVDVGKPNGQYDSHSVRERVRQWQAQGGGVVFTDDLVTGPEEDGQSGDRVEETAPKSRKATHTPTKHTPPKRRIPPEEPRTTDTHRRRTRRDKSEEPTDQQRPRSVSAPRRRIVSDGHWRSDRATPDRHPQSAPKKRPQPSWAEPDDGIRVRPLPEDESRPDRKEDDHGQRAQRHDRFDDGIRVYSAVPDVDQFCEDSKQHQGESTFAAETCTEERLTFHSPTPSERHDMAMRSGCELSTEGETPSPKRDRDGAYGARERDHRPKRSHGVRFAEPEKPNKKHSKGRGRSGIFSNVLEESKKIFTRVDPAPVQEPRIPSIESWLNGTPDPFVDDSTFGPSGEVTAIEEAAPEPEPQVVLPETPPETPPERRKRRSRTPQQSGDPNKIWNTLDAPKDSSRRNHERRSYQREGIEASGDSKTTRRREEEPSLPDTPTYIRGEALDSSPSSLRRRGANKRSATTKGAGRSSLSALKSAFVVKTEDNPLSGSSLSSAHSEEPLEPIAPLNIRSKPLMKSTHEFGRKLSTIASADTFQASASQRYNSTQPEGSNHDTDKISESEAVDAVSPNGLKRQRSRITKHGDLMSMLSQPNCKRGKSLRSARSVRTTRSKFEIPSVPKVMEELAADEEKYMRELRTLVDGVIPVLLSSILSKSEAAITVGLFSKKAKNDPSATKPIYDMGIALERLKRAHKRIDVKRPDFFLNWARSTQYIYWDYLQAWRMGFQDVVVNLAPAEVKADMADMGSTVSAGLQRNANGDVIDSEGERVDVAFLLKRPLIRLRNLSRTVRDLNAAQTSADSEEMDKKYRNLVEEARNRVNEERARLEDEAAATIDPNRARDLRTLALRGGATISDTRHVRARDCFNLTLHHTSGQVIDCRVELILREEQNTKEPSGGDILICEIDGTGRWLLFPPVNRGDISARNGDQKGEIVVMIRGKEAGDEPWQELLSLISDEEEAGFEWVQMLGLIPVPPGVQRSRSFIERQKNSRGVTPAIAPEPHVGQPISASQVHTSPQVVMDVPLGETVSSRSKHRTGSGALESSERVRDRAKIRKPQHLPASSPSHDSQEVDIPIRASPSDPRRSVEPLIPVPPPLNINSPARSTPRTAERTPSYSTPVSAKLRKPNPAISSSPTSPSPQIEKESSPTSPPSAARKVPKVSTIPAGTIPELVPDKNKNLPNSPLKQEYEPSTASESSSESDASSVQKETSSASDSEDAEFEDGDIAMPLLPPGALNRLKSGANVNPTSHVSRASIGPSESASQAPYKQVPSQPDQATKTIASIFYWSAKGAWDPIHPDECSIVVTPGLIEAYEMSALHSKLSQAELNAGLSDAPSRPSSAGPRPLIGLELTPLVPIRRGTALDISVRSPPTADSKIKDIQNANIMFRSRNPEECEALYALINMARINNPTYIALQNARATSFAKPFGGASFDGAKSGSRSSWFGFGGGRRSSYRASSAPTPSAGRQSESSAGSAASAFSALRRLGASSSKFNIARSTITSRKGGSRASGSVFSSSEQSSSSGTSTPLPPGIAGAMGVIDAASAEGAAPIGLSNAKIRLYIRETASKWRDLGAARLTIMRPTGTNGVGGALASVDSYAPTVPASEPALRAPGSGEPSASDKRVLVTSKKTNETLLDVTLGETCFERVARTGIAVSVWETTLSEEGHVARQGGVSGGRVKVYMLQMSSEAETAYTFGIVGKFRY